MSEMSDDTVHVLVSMVECMRIARLLAERGKPEAAERWRAKAREAMEGNALFVPRASTDVDSCGK